MAKLAWDGLDLLALPAALTRSGVHIDLISGFVEPPEYRGTWQTVPSADGQVPWPLRPDRKPIVLEGFVRGTDPEDWLTQTGILTAKFDPNVTVDLVIDDGYLGTTGTWTIAVRYGNAISQPPAQSLGSEGPSLQRWSIELKGVDMSWTG